MSQERIVYGFNQTPYGKIVVAQSKKGVCWLAFVTDKSKDAVLCMKNRLGKAEYLHDDSAISEWKTFPLDLRGTVFQRQVWQALQDIPEGTTVTYTDIATAVKRPKAVRAVGTAIGKNPVSLRIPCHRVVRRDGGLGGYAWGIERKKQILLDEQAC